VNARDAMPSGGTLTIRTDVAAGDDVRRRFPEAAGHRYLTVTVADSGKGMSEETRRRVFEPFFSTKKERGGSGLGLAVAYGVVESHGGFIDVESEENRGSLFRMQLPAADGEGSTAKDKKERRARPPVSPTKGSRSKTAVRGPLGASPDGAPDSPETILVVEDEPELRNSMRELMESEGFRVLTASDGEDAVRIYREHARRIRLVVSDLQMPRLSGGDTFLRIRECDGAAKVILASGHLEPGRRAEMSAAGVSAHLLKPIRPDEMIRTIRSVLES